MYRSYTQIFRIFGAVIIFLQISKVAALFKIQKNKKSPCSLSLSLADRQDPHVSDRERTRRRYRLRPAKCADGVTLARWTAPS